MSEVSTKDIMNLAMVGGSFDFLYDEPDIYTLEDGEPISIQMKYIVIVEKSENNYSAYVPDLPGCVTTGEDIAEIEQNIKEAISGHLAIMQEFGDPLPEPFHRIDISAPETTILQVFIPELAIA